MPKPFSSFCAICALALFPLTTVAKADTLDRWENGYRNYRATPLATTLQGRDYTIKSETVDANGQPVTIETEVENDRRERTIDTKITGPDGLISGKKVETEYSRDEIETKTTTTNPDGTIDIQHETIDIDD